uniref:U1 protein n=1 Tax=Subterranean clover stunt virus TaxID=36772 RepID=A0A345G0H5_SCSV|nr:U1 protein [Subterranean clover stunt virus]
MVSFSFPEIYDVSDDVLVSDSRRSVAVEVEEKVQVINVKVLRLIEAVDEDRVGVKVMFRLCYRYRRELKITLLGCKMELWTSLKSSGKYSVQSLLQRKLNGICVSNYCIGIDMFVSNVKELINRCKWITSVQDVNPICCLYHMEEE